MSVTGFNLRRRMMAVKKAVTSKAEEVAEVKVEKPAPKATEPAKEPEIVHKKTTSKKK